MVRVLRPAEVAERSDTQDETAASGPVAEFDLADDADWLMSADDEDDWDEDEDDDEDDFDLDDEDDDEVGDDDE